jgi:hypothetical protein
MSLLKESLILAPIMPPATIPKPDKEPGIAIYIENSAANPQSEA